ncbi:MAG: glycerate kinase, partial [Micrococcales bacterium]|nr:glycerate kinase [Micrococcales bacterium]
SWARVLREATGIDLDHAGPDGRAWGGAAGALGGGLRAALRAEPRGGLDELAELLEIEAALDGVALLVVGEGSIDEQTALGKAPVALARRARARGIRTLAIAGRSTLPPTALAADGIDRIVTAAEYGGASALTDPRRWVAAAAQGALAGAVPHPPRSPLPLAPTPYFHFLRTPRNSWWRNLLLLVSLAVAFVASAALFGVIGVVVDLASGRTALEDYREGNVPITPVLFLANNLSLAALIPISFLLQWAWTRQRPRWLSSVAGGFRWKWFGVVSAIAGPIWIGYLVLDTTLQGGLGELRLSPDWLFMLIAVLLTTPFQSAGEEYAFRGVAVRAIAGWIPIPALAWAVGSLVPTVVFMSLHFATDPWLNVFYLAFGLAGSVLAWTTGGLEATIVVHVVNNTVLLLPVALWGDVGSAFSRGAGVGSPLVLIGVGSLALVIVVISLVARRMGIARVGPPRLGAAGR